MWNVSLSSVTLALLDAATDKDAEVQEQVRKSMLTLGKQQPDRVLAMCQDYLMKHPKLVVTHRVVILQTIELIVGCRIEEISYPRIKSIISLASDEMTRSKEVIPDWQQAASNILVAVGNKHINDIMEEILSKFQPGLLPHFFVVQTLANLSDSNVYGMVPFLNAILGTMLPMLSMAKQDNMKWVFSSALCHFSDSILEYLANLDKAPDPTVRKDTFSSEIYAAFDILFNNWLQSRESKVRLTVAEAVGSMCHLMTSDKLEEQIPKLIPSILSLYKKNNEHYIISKSLCQIIILAVTAGLFSLLLSGLSCVLHLFLYFCDKLCFHFFLSTSSPLHLANSFPDRLVIFVLQKLENSNERSRVGSLAVLRHLINSSTSTMEGKKLLILASIRQPMADHSNKVKKRVIQVISAMAHHGYLELEGGELLVRFIVQHCALHDTYQRGQRPTDPEEVTNESLRAMCDNTLHLLTTTVGRLADVLWPKLLYFLTPPQFSNATTPLCKSLIELGNKKKNNQDPTFPFNSRDHGAPSLLLLQTLSINLHPNTEILWEKEIPPLLSVLEGMEICGHYVLYAIYIKYFLYRCIGVTLQQCFNKELVKKQLQEILLTARHNDAIEREGVAMGVGLCANSHLEGTLAKLDEFGKSDAFKKSPSIFNLLKERNDVEVEKVKSTLILCYGQVALNAPPEKILNRIDQDILRCISKHFNTKDLTMKLSLIQSVGLIAKAITECVKKQGYVFSRKQELINVMLALYKDTLAALQELLRSVLARDPTPDGLQSVFKHIESWLSSGQDHERERAATATAHILAYYLDNLTVKNMVSFHNLGALLGRLSPRCSDPHPAVRTAAVDCIYTLLYIQLRYEGFSLDYKDEAVDSLLPLKDRLENPDHSVLYKTCSDLTKVMSKRLPQQQLSTLVFMLFEGLVDSQTNCCRASSVILNTLLKNRGGGLQELVLLIFLCRTKNSSPTLVFSMEDMWMALGGDPIVASQIIEMVMEKLAIMAPYVDKKESMIRGGTTKVATNQPLATQEPAVSLFPRLFSCLTVRLGASVGVSAPKDNNTKHTASVHTNNVLDEVMKRLDEDNAWDAMKEQNTHITGVTLLARAMSKHAGPRLPAIVECLCPSLNNIYECQRITVTAFFSELLNHHVVTELMLIDVLMNNMMERISDPCCTVRMLSVRGLGNIAVGSPEKVQYSHIYNSTSKLITLEAMSGLSKVLLYLDKKNVHLLVVYIFMKIKPFLESENDEIRCASIHLMGNLSKFGSGEPVFKDQIHNVLVSLLLHLVDPNPQVVKACKYAMRVCAPVVGSEQITAMFQNHLHDDKSLHYGEFINDLTKYLVRHTQANRSLVMLLQDPDPVVRVKAAEAMGRFH
uniref:Maestro heat-like repeat family member 1 n=1 Tax=Dicentrarchus labrax TaxID=13489 RepID=A0A8C4D9K4_DICLA